MFTTPSCRRIRRFITCYSLRDALFAISLLPFLICTWPPNPRNTVLLFGNRSPTVVVVGTVVLNDSHPGIPNDTPPLHLLQLDLIHRGDQHAYHSLLQHLSTNGTCPLRL